MTVSHLKNKLTSEALNYSTASATLFQSCGNQVIIVIICLYRASTRSAALPPVLSVAQMLKQHSLQLNWSTEAASRLTFAGKLRWNLRFWKITLLRSSKSGGVDSRVKFDPMQYFPLFWHGLWAVFLRHQMELMHILQWQLKLYCSLSWIICKTLLTIFFWNQMFINAISISRFINETMHSVNEI